MVVSLLRNLRFTPPSNDAVVDEQELRQLLPISELSSKGEEKQEVGQESFEEFGCSANSGVLPKCEIPFDLYVKVITRSRRIMMHSMNLTDDDSAIATIVT